MPRLFLRRGRGQSAGIEKPWCMAPVTAETIGNLAWRGIHGRVLVHRTKEMVRQSASTSATRGRSPQHGSTEQGRGMWWTKLAMEGYETWSRPAVLSMFPSNFLNLVAQPVTFSLPQQEIRYFSGSKFDKRLNIYDDEFAPGKLEFTWKLVDPDGKGVQARHDKHEINHAYLRRDASRSNCQRSKNGLRLCSICNCTKTGIARTRTEDRGGLASASNPSPSPHRRPKPSRCSTPRARLGRCWNASDARRNRIRRVDPRSIGRQPRADHRAQLRDGGHVGRTAGGATVRSGRRSGAGTASAEASLLPANTFVEKRGHSRWGSCAPKDIR